MLSDPSWQDCKSKDGYIKKQVRDAIIANDNCHWQLSVWDDLIDQIQDAETCEITKVSLRYFNGLKLSTTVWSRVNKVHSKQKVQWEDILKQNQEGKTKNNFTICCPEVQSVTLNDYPICIRKDCSKKLTPVPREKHIKCTRCSAKMLLSKCQCGLTVNIQLNNGEKDITLTLFPKVLDKFLEEDTVTLYQQNPEVLEEKLLLLEKVDFTYTSNKVVTKLSNHPDHNLTI